MFSAGRQAGNEYVEYMGVVWAGDKTDHMSSSGHLFCYGDRAISWASKRQTTMALSSTEAEYVSAAQACQEVIWLHQWLKDLGIVKPQPI